MIQQILIGILMFATVVVHAANPSDEVKLEILPSSPVVILGDARDITGRVVKGPWFALQISLSNQFVETVHVSQVRLNIVHRINGIAQPAITRTFSAEDFSHNMVCGSVIVPLFYTDLGKFTSGQASRLHLTYRGNPLPKECLGQDSGDRIPVFYVGDLPRRTAGTYEYEVLGLVSGWFEAAGKPTTRFEQVIQFKTQ